MFAFKVIHSHSLRMMLSFPFVPWLLCEVQRPLHICSFEIGNGDKHPQSLFHLVCEKKLIAPNKIWRDSNTKMNLTVVLWMECTGNPGAAPQLDHLPSGLIAALDTIFVWRKIKLSVLSFNITAAIMEAQHVPEFFFLPLSSPLLSSHH